MSKDWYRKKSWTNSDEQDFNTRLKRARKDNQAQYLKIQAIEFLETKKPKLLDVAEQLLNQYFEEHPDDTFNRSSALHVLGKIYEHRKEFESAITYFKKAVDFELEHPNYKTQADLDFSDLVVKLEKPEHFELVEQLMNKRLENSLFPVEKYRGYSILAIIAMSRNDQANFERFKELAEENATQETSGLRYHQNLGTVKKRDSWLDKLLTRK